MSYKHIIFLGIACFVHSPTIAQPQKLMDTTLIECNIHFPEKAYSQKKYSLLLLNSKDTTYDFMYLKKGYRGVELNFQGKYLVDGNSITLQDFFWRERKKNLRKKKKVLYYKNGKLYTKMFVGIPMSKKVYMIIPRK